MSGGENPGIQESLTEGIKGLRQKVPRMLYALKQWRIRTLQWLALATEVSVVESTPQDTVLSWCLGRYYMARLAEPIAANAAYVNRTALRWAACWVLNLVGFESKDSGVDR